jgi:hypothetical protein
MIELLITACLATSPCRDVSFLYDPRQVSYLTCVYGGQAEVARWQSRNPLWRVKRWRCGWLSDKTGEA